MIALVAAMDAAGLIGVGGRLPWHLPADLAHFRALTMGGVVVMGRKTYESLGRPLAGRQNVVVTRRLPANPSGAVSWTTAPRTAVLDRASRCGKVFVIGGASVFALALPLADTLHLTRIAHTFPAGAGAVHFPPWNPAAWRLLSSETRAPDAANEWAMTFERWERR